MDTAQFNQFLQLQQQMFKDLLELHKTLSTDSTVLPTITVNTALVPTFDHFDPGAKYFNMLSALSAPQFPKDKTYEELICLLEKHLASKKNVLVAQHQFLSKYQTESQSISEFVASLRADTGDCQFISDGSCKSSIANAFLRAQFIRGIRDNSIRESILQSGTLSFEDIVAKAISLEASKIDSRELLTVLLFFSEDSF